MKNKKSKKQSGSVAEIIAKSCGIEKVEYDPALSDLFSSNKYQVKVNDETPPDNDNDLASEAKKHALPDAKGEKSNKGDVTLSHRDAASIRVNAKQKSKQAKSDELESNSDQSVEEPEPEISAKKQGKTKKRKKSKKEVEHDEEDENEDSIAVQPKGEQEVTIETSLATNKKIKLEGKDGDEKEADKVLSIAELNAQKSKNPEKEARTVFVGNVPKDCTKKRLSKLFQTHGEIEAIRFRGAAPSKPTQLKKVAIYRNEIHPDRNNLVAFIRYKSREEAEQATKVMNGILVQEHHLTVDMADNKEKDNSKAIFIGNMSLKMNDDELWNHFQDCGKIHSVRIVRDPITGLGRGIGFVNFEDSVAVDLALKKNGTELKGRPLRISKATTNKKKKKSPNSGQPTAQNTSSSDIPRKDNRKPKSDSWNGKSNRGGSGPKKPDNNFAGDKIAEAGTLKRKSNKPNRGEVKKARIAKKLIGKSYTKTETKPKKNKRL